MSIRLEALFLALAVILSTAFLGYAISSRASTLSSEYGLTADNVPCNFQGNKTLILDFQSNNRALEVHTTYLYIRSECLSFYDLNISDGHQDLNVVSGDYCYATVPAQNATLTTIREVNRYQLSSWNGSVTVKTTAYSRELMVLQVNSSDDASLIIRAVDLEYPYRYKVSVDGVEKATLQVNLAGYVEYNYSGAWSNHTIILNNVGAPVIVPQPYLGIIQLFLILGVVISVVKTMILPLRHKNLPQSVITRNLIQAAIYILIATTLIILFFEMFVPDV